MLRRLKLLFFRHLTAGDVFAFAQLSLPPPSAKLPNAGSQRVWHVATGLAAMQNAGSLA
jgi:hypothetical protein